jgi:hypothetical protein
VAEAAKATRAERLLIFAAVNQQERDGLRPLPIKVVPGDVFFWHGELAVTLRRMVAPDGGEVVSYSPSDQQWRDRVIPAMQKAGDLEEVAAALERYAVVLRERRLEALASRVLHRAVNRLAPLLIDIDACNDFAREGNPDGIAAHCREMQKDWSSHPHNHPLYCLSYFHGMVSGKTGLFGALMRKHGLEAAKVEDSEVLWLRRQEMKPRSKELLEALIKEAGLIRTLGLAGGDGRFRLARPCKPLKYIVAITALVRDSQGSHGATLIDELVRNGQVNPKADAVAAMLGGDGFSYSLWLEDIARLLEMLGKSLTVPEESLA